MPIDASIPLGIKQPEFENPLNALAKVMQIKGMQQESQMGQMKMDEYQRSVDDQNALRTELSQPGADPYRALLNRGKIKEATEYQKGQNDSAKQKIDLIDAKLKQSRTFLDQVQTPEQFIEWHKANHADPVLGPELAARGVTAEQSMATIKQALSEPGGFQRLLQKSAMGLEKFTEANKPTTTVVNAGGTSQILQTPGLGGTPTLAGTVQHTVSPDAQLSANTSTANNKRTIAAENMRAGVSADGTPVDGGGLLSPESVINAATRYNMDGTLPPNLGRGTQGPRQTAQILNEAARQAAAKGDSPEAQRIAQLANKANAQALGTIEKQSTMVGAFEKNFNKNADIALELSQKVDRTGVPILNKWINAGRRAVTGDPDLAAFDANIKATVNEYAKIVGGGTGSGATAQGEIAKIEGLLSAAQTPQAVASVIAIMKRETANRMSAYEDQKAELRNSMIRPGSAKPAQTQPAAPSRGAPAAGAMQDGYRFKGGDPSNKANWEKI